MFLIPSCLSRPIFLVLAGIISRSVCESVNIFPYFVSYCSALVGSIFTAIVLFILFCKVLKCFLAQLGFILFFLTKNYCYFLLLLLGQGQGCVTFCCCCCEEGGVFLSVCLFCFVCFSFPLFFYSLFLFVIRTQESFFF